MINPVFLFLSLFHGGSNIFCLCRNFRCLFYFIPASGRPFRVFCFLLLQFSSALNCFSGRDMFRLIRNNILRFCPVDHKSVFRFNLQILIILHIFRHKFVHIRRFFLPASAFTPWCFVVSKCGGKRYTGNFMICPSLSRITVIFFPDLFCPLPFFPFFCTYCCSFLMLLLCILICLSALTAERSKK